MVSFIWILNTYILFMYSDRAIVSYGANHSSISFQNFLHSRFSVGVWWLFRDTNSCCGWPWTLWVLQPIRGNWWSNMHPWLLLMWKTHLLLLRRWLLRLLQLRWQRLRLLVLHLMLHSWCSVGIVTRRCHRHSFVTQGYLFLQYSLYVGIAGGLLEMLTVHSVTERVHDSNLMWAKANKKKI